MAKAANTNVTRRSLAPHNATALAALWPEHERVREALDQANASDDDEAIANDALWNFDDCIMATPVTNIADLAVKARVIKDHVEISGEFITAIQDYTEQLLADIEKLAA